MATAMPPWMDQVAQWPPPKLPLQTSPRLARGQPASEGRGGLDRSAMCGRCRRQLQGVRRSRSDRRDLLQCPACSWAAAQVSPSSTTLRNRRPRAPPRYGTTEVRKHTSTLLRPCASGGDPRRRSTNGLVGAVSTGGRARSGGVRASHLTIHSSRRAGRAFFLACALMPARSHCKARRGPPGRACARRPAAGYAVAAWRSPPPAAGREELREFFSYL